MLSEPGIPCLRDRTTDPHPQHPIRINRMPSTTPVSRQHELNPYGLGSAAYLAKKAGKTRASKACTRCGLLMRHPDLLGRAIHSRNGTRVVCCTTSLTHTTSYTKKRKSGSHYLACVPCQQDVCQAGDHGWSDAAAAGTLVASAKGDITVQRGAKASSLLVRDVATAAFPEMHSVCVATENRLETTAHKFAASPLATRPRTNVTRSVLLDGKSQLPAPNQESYSCDGISWTPMSLTDAVMVPGRYPYGDYSVDHRTNMRRTCGRWPA